jgi:hypothetical protein
MKVSKTDPLLEFHQSRKIRQPTTVTRDTILNYLERCVRIVKSIPLFVLIQMYKKKRAEMSLH